MGVSIGMGQFLPTPSATRSYCPGTALPLPSLCLLTVTLTPALSLCTKIVPSPFTTPSATYWGPAGPSSPFEPVSPFGPVGPVSPLEPFGPVGPVSPLEPFAPCGPVGPVRFQSSATSSFLQNVVFLLPLPFGSIRRTLPLPASCLSPLTW